MLAYRLVYHGIGGRTVGELIEDSGMTRDEFLTWAAFFNLEPRDEQRLDLHVARLMSLYVNMNRPTGKSQVNAQQFLPQFGYRPKRVMTPEEMRDAARGQLARATRQHGQLGLKPKEETP